MLELSRTLILFKSFTFALLHLLVLVLQISYTRTQQNMLVTEVTFLS